MGKMFQTIRMKLVIWFLVVALIPLAASSIISYNQSAEQLIQKRTRINTQPCC